MNVEPNSKKVIEELRDALSQLNSLDGNSIDAIAVLLSMDDAQFELVSSGILDSFLRSLNTTNARLMLAQSINATGSTAESVQDEFLQLVNEIDTITDLTAPKRDFL